MSINILQDNYGLKEFLENETISQGCVTFNSISHSDVTLFLIKIKELGGSTAVMYNRRYSSSSIDMQTNLEFLCSFNNKEKYCIYKPYYMIDCQKEFTTAFEGITNFKVCNIEEVTTVIAEEYTVALGKMFDNNIEFIRNKYEQYDMVYEDTLVNFRKDVIRRYLNQHITIRDTMAVDTSKIKLMSLVRIQEYVVAPEKVVYAMAYKEFDKSIQSWSEYGLMAMHARHAAENHIIEDVKTNPSDFIKLSLAIRECIEKGGKTLLLTLKDLQEVKVTNSFSGYHFNSVTGYRTISIEDISKITFGKKVLYQA